MKPRNALFSIALAFLSFAHVSDAHAQGRTLNDLASIEYALSQGHRVTAAVDLSLCTPEDGSQSASRMKGGLTVSPYVILPDSTLAFSDTHFTVANSGRPILQSLRYRVKPDGSIAFTSTIFSLPDYSLVSQVGFRCAIGNGVTFVSSPW